MTIMKTARSVEEFSSHRQVASVLHESKEVSTLCTHANNGTKAFLDCVVSYVSL